MTNVFYYFTHDEAPFRFPGAPFFLGFLLMAASAYFVYVVFHKNRQGTMN
jgi:DHA1 family tetracycline resistance protein-like MFS transporter